MELLATVEGRGVHWAHSPTKSINQKQNNLVMITKNVYWLSEIFHNNLFITSLLRFLGNDTGHKKNREPTVLRLYGAVTVHTLQ